MPAYAMKKRLKKGMLMTPNLAQAAHKGRKTVTRRIVKPPPKYVDELPSDAIPGEVAIVEGKVWRCSVYSQNQPDAIKWRYLQPRLRPGDIVAIKETHWRWGFHYRNENNQWSFHPVTGDPVEHVVFKRQLIQNAPPHRDSVGYHKRSALFLPYDYARTHVLIEDVRPERLQDITEEDAQNEGAVKMHLDDLGQSFRSHKRGFQVLWDSINGKTYPWASNPWIWRYQFHKVTGGC